jgi:hypothetical protein
MSHDPHVPPAPPAGPPEGPGAPGAPAAFAPVYVPFGVHPRPTVLEALRRALVVAEAHPEGTRFLFEMHLDTP